MGLWSSNAGAIVQLMDQSSSSLSRIGFWRDSMLLDPVQCGQNDWPLVYISPVGTKLNRDLRCLLKRRQKLSEYQFFLVLNAECYTYLLFNAPLCDFKRELAMLQANSNTHVQVHR